MVERFLESSFWDLGWKAIIIVAVIATLILGGFTYLMIGETAFGAGFCHWHYIWEWWSGNWHLVWAYTCSIWWG